MCQTSACSNGAVKSTLLSRSYINARVLYQQAKHKAVLWLHNELVCLLKVVIFYPSVPISDWNTMPDWSLKILQLLYWLQSSTLNGLQTVLKAMWLLMLSWNQHVTDDKMFIGKRLFFLDCLWQSSDHIFTVILNYKLTEWHGNILGLQLKFVNPNERKMLWFKCTNIAYIGNNFPVETFTLTNELPQVYLHLKTGNMHMVNCGTNTCCVLVIPCRRQKESILW